MSKVQIDGQHVDIKRKSRNPIIEFDYLQMYCGRPYVIDLESAKGTLTLYQPTMGKIITIGANKFYSTLNAFICNTNSYRLFLWENKIDWNECRDFDLFIMLLPTIDKEALELLLGDVDITKFKICQKNDELVLWDETLGIEINEEVYFHMSQYYRNVFKMFPEEKITKDRVLKNWYISKDKREAERKAKSATDEANDASLTLQALISSCINHPGFKYNLHQLDDVGVAEFYDSVQRLQIYESSTALMKGMYSGFVDSSKIKPDDYNFMKLFKN